jgi:YebC/PmpR family DNA-binding regulatory protein
MAGQSIWTNVRYRKRESREGLDRSRQPVRYEGYGPGGSAVMVECLTDNRNRTCADVRRAFIRNGGNLGADGSVAYLFNEVGLMKYPPGTDGGRLSQCALEAGAEDVVPHEDGSIEVVTDPDELDVVCAVLSSSGFEPSDTVVTQRAAIPAHLHGEAAQAMVSLLGTLEHLDDVENVYSNAQVPDEVLARV